MKVASAGAHPALKWRIGCLSKSLGGLCELSKHNSKTAKHRKHVTEGVLILLSHVAEWWRKLAIDNASGNPIDTQKRTTPKPDNLPEANLATQDCMMRAAQPHYTHCPGWSVSQVMFTLPLIGETVLLTVTVIDSALVAILLLTSLRACISATHFYTSPVLAVAALTFFLVQEQILDISRQVGEYFRPTA